MKQIIKRNAELKSNLNKHLSKLTGKESDFFSKLKNEDILELKTVLSDIHNLLTLKLTIASAVWICDYFEIEDVERSKILEKIDAIKPNEQGFDIVLQEPIKLIGEVKCTSPINNGFKFGVAQRNSILDDIQKLKNGKRQLTDTSNYLKFMFVIDLGDRTSKAIVDILKKTNIRIETQSRLNRNIARDTAVIFNNKTKPSELDLNNVYFKVIKLE
jgi:hypothetical protein